MSDAGHEDTKESPGGVETPRPGDPAANGGFVEILLAFLKLGLVSFGGPIAHLGYFRDEFVTRRRWLDDASYADLVALCQFLPGPSSSQVGFAIGILRRGGVAGGIAAWLGFTLPSAMIMVAFGLWAASLDQPFAQPLLQGLKLVAVAIVAQAVLGMARSLAPDLVRRLIALAALAIALLAAAPAGQLVPIAGGALAGLWLCRGAVTVSVRQSVPVSPRAGIAALVLFALLLFGLPVADILSHSRTVAVFEAFYRSGALVFGGGHVVLPLLQSAVVDQGWVTGPEFLTGYGVAQALPGPLFTFAAYLGATMGPMPAYGLAIGSLALVAIFLPGLLLIYGMLPLGSLLRSHPRAAAAALGTNAVVVGILAAAFYDPVLVGSVSGPQDAALALCGMALLIWLKAPSWLVVVLLPLAELLLWLA